MNLLFTNILRRISLDILLSVEYRIDNRTEVDDHVNEAASRKVHRNKNLARTVMAD